MIRLVLVILGILAVPYAVDAVAHVVFEARHLSPPCAQPTLACPKETLW